jgi:uncharacterized protein (TIGR03067 family)
MANLRLKFDGEKFTITIGAAEKKDGAFKLDPAKKSPTIDLTPDDEKDRPALGIYKLDGDELTLAVAEPNNPRPTEFVPNKPGKVAVLILKREKK